MRKHVPTQVGYHTFAQCDDKEVARRGSQRQNAGENKEPAKIVADEARIFGDEAIIDHLLERKRQRQCG